MGSSMTQIENMEDVTGKGGDSSSLMATLRDATYLAGLISTCKKEVPSLVRIQQLRLISSFAAGDILKGSAN